MLFVLRFVLQSVTLRVSVSREQRKVKTMSQSSVYFGGSRNLHQTPAQLPSVLNTLINSGQSVNVGCQSGVDKSVITCMRNFPSRLSVFVVAAHHSQAPAHVIAAGATGARVIFGAGGTSAPVPARYLLRSIAAFQGCQSAVFFSPGAGSLAVARECVKAGLPVYAFQQEPPARIPSTVGTWLPAVFFGFSCWQWYQSVKQQTLF
jgi:hypothetical protein